MLQDFVETEIYSKLYNMVLRVESTERYNNINNIHVIGPKATGNTTALKKLEI